MIEIDGSFGEGGGQIIRTSVALSAVTGEPVRITNIRANRPNPGLAAQHMNAVRAVGRLVDADTKNLRIASKTLEFIPKRVEGGKLNINIGTAGSITLLLQSLMPAALFADLPVEIDITGGTDVAWSPPIDFLRYVLRPILGQMGYEANVELIRRGYYPKGGGKVKATLNPAKLEGIELEKAANGGVKGISHCSKLPPHVVRRQKDAATRILEENGYDAEIRIERANYISTGNGITLYSGLKSGTSLGKKGKPAEEVGEEAASSLISELRSDSAVDKYVADQLIPYMGIAGDSKIVTSQLSEHTKTNIWLTERFLDVEFEVDVGDVVSISV